MYLQGIFNFQEYSKYLQVQLILLGLTKVTLQVMESNACITEIRIAVKSLQNVPNAFFLHFSLKHFFRIVMKQDSKLTCQPVSETGSLYKQLIPQICLPKAINRIIS